MNDLNGKIALITGATSGIGEACARRLAQAGASVIVAGRNVDRGEEICRQIEETGEKAKFVCLDLADDSSINNAYEFVERNYGRLDILVNNAGIYPVTPPIEDVDREFCSTVFDINVTGMLMVTKKFLNMIIASKGNILNNASVAGLEGYTSGGAYAYSASKAGVIKITKLLAKKYGSSIRVNCFCPGVIRTPIFKKFDEERYASAIPMGRVGEPDDVAKVVNFLVSSDAGYLNGCVLEIDGGQSL